MSKLIEDNLIGAIRSAGDVLLKCTMIATAVEFCGSFLTKETNKGTTESNFLEFWKSRYIPSKYHEIGELMYEVFRNGVSHSFIAKGGVIPSGEEKSAKKHLEFFEQGIFIYVPELEKDVIAGISRFLEDLKNKSELQENYRFVLSELNRVGKERYDEFVKKYKIQVSQETIAGDIFPDIQFVLAGGSLDLIPHHTGSTISKHIKVEIKVKPANEENFKA